MDRVHLGLDLPSFDCVAFHDVQRQGFCLEGNAFLQTDKSSVRLCQAPQEARGGNPRRDSRDGPRPNQGADDGDDRGPRAAAVTATAGDGSGAIWYGSGRDITCAFTMTAVFACSPRERGRPPPLPGPRSRVRPSSGQAHAAAAGAAATTRRAGVPRAGGGGDGKGAHKGGVGVRLVLQVDGNRFHGDASRGGRWGGGLRDKSSIRGGMAVAVCLDLDGWTDGGGHLSIRWFFVPFLPFPPKPPATIPARHVHDDDDLTFLSHFLLSEVIWV
ncbi:unnamed protein product [Discosporangium mesarthrocarpum]